MQGVLYHKGISLLEVAFFLIALTILSLFVADKISSRTKSLESKIIAEQIKTVSAALNLYIASFDSMDDVEFPLEVKNSTLVKAGYLPSSKKDSNYLTDGESNYIIKLQSAGNKKPSLMGITLLCLKGLEGNRLSVVNNLGFSGGTVLYNNPSAVLGALDGWGLKLSDYPSISANPLIKNKYDCVFNLSSYEPIVNQSDSLNHRPSLTPDEINISGMISGSDIPLMRGGIWGPLYTSDALVVTNNSNDKDIIIEVINAKTNEVVSRGHYLETKNKIFISDDYVGMNIFLRIIPVDSAGHQGDAVVMPQNGKQIKISTFSGSLFNQVSFQVQANLFNHDFSVPIDPLNNTRSDIGECRDTPMTGDTGDTAAGVDVEGVRLDLTRSQAYSPYLTPHVISFFVNDKLVLRMKISNPSLVPFKNLTWGSYDMRNNHSPLIPGSDVSGTGFFLLTPSCNKSDRKNVRFDIRIDGTDYPCLNKNWDGSYPLWKPFFVTLSELATNLWDNNESINK
ncbi:hypothetical protein ACSFCW_07165 [Yokenella regensburgei]|uniref:hypothetical protein n=1 Tax=Yokenella regensburgei TaxID=158877 RepID=UPI003EDA364E